MKKIWKLIDSLKFDKKTKNKMFIIIMSILNALIGYLLSCLVPIGLSNSICIIGYFALFVGFYGSILYLYNHDFK